MHGKDSMLGYSIDLVLVTRLSLLRTEFEVLGTLDAQLLLGLTLLAFQTKHNFTSCLGLLVKNWLCLTSKTHLFGIVTTFSLSKVGCLTSLVLSHLVHPVSLASLSGTVSSAFFRDIDHSFRKLKVTRR